jgi:hypothetical protein
VPSERRERAYLPDGSTERFIEQGRRDPASVGKARVLTTVDYDELPGWVAA